MWLCPATSLYRDQSVLPFLASSDLLTSKKCGARHDFSAGTYLLLEVLHHPCPQGSQDLCAQARDGFVWLLPSLEYQLQSDIAGVHQTQVRFIGGRSTRIITRAGFELRTIRKNNLSGISELPEASTACCDRSIFWLMTAELTHASRSDVTGHWMWQCSALSLRRKDQSATPISA